jgi:hypothetical protein
MATLSREQIIKRAKEFYVQECYRNGTPELADVTPEISESIEAGFLSVAQSDLMRNFATKNAEWQDYNPTEILDFQFDVNEAFKSGIYCSGTTGSGKSDVGMLCIDAIKRAYPNCVFIVFDPSQDWMQRSSVARVQTVKSTFVDSIPRESIVYDLSMLSVRDCQKLIESFSEKLMMQQALTRSQTRYFLCFEEAQIYFPEGCMRSKAYQNSVRMLTQGRNFKVRFICITQFASLLDKNAMRYMKQRYFGYTDEPNDVNYIGRIIRKSEAEKLQSLNAGEFVYFNRGKTIKIAIEPYKNSVSKEYIATSIPQPKTLEPQSKATTTDYNPLLRFVVVVSIGLTILLLGMS